MSGCLLVTYGNLWQLMATYGNLWQLMAASVHAAYLTLNMLNLLLLLLKHTIVKKFTTMLLKSAGIILCIEHSRPNI